MGIPGFAKEPSTWLVIAVALLFVAMATFAWKMYVSPRINPDYVANCEFNGGCRNEEKGGPALYYFYTVWCPHCKTASPIWEELKTWADGRKFGGQELTFVSVDCDERKDVASEFGVSGFPTIKLVTPDRTVDYDAKPDLSTLQDFLSREI